MITVFNPDYSLIQLLENNTPRRLKPAPLFKRGFFVRNAERFDPGRVKHENSPLSRG